ncbi:hypothetical protein [Sorangium sp. So ce513]|uniref:hypothetical protein n=1 Tax=Sorangium sp. So ce513 TaxID=3133315 RepID=UPI003F644B34
MARTSEAVGSTSRLHLCGPTALCLAALVTMLACKPIARGGGGGSGGSAGDGGGDIAGVGGNGSSVSSGGSSADAGSGGSSADAGSGGSSADAGSGGSSADAGSGGSSADAGSGGSSADAGSGGSSADAGSGGSSADAGSGGSSADAGSGGSSADAGSGGSSADAGSGGFAGAGGSGGFAGAGGSSSGDGGGGASSSTGSGGSPGTCVPGSIIACYSGPAGTRDVGLCAAGTQICHPDGFGYGPCTGEVTPTQEICGTPEDESCDGDPSCPQPAAWARGFGGPGIDSASSIASDAAGNYYVIGSFEGTVDFGAGPLTSAGGEDIFLLKLDPSGTLIWSKRFGTVHREVGDAVTVDGNGDVLLAGRYDGDLWDLPTGLDFGGCSLPGPADIGRTPMFLAKLDADGNHVWSKGFMSTVRHRFVHKIAVDALGNMYIAYDEDELATVMKLDAAGNQLWSHGLRGYPAGSTELAIDGAGNVVTSHAGMINEIVSYVFVSKFSPSGDLLWRYRGPYSDVAYGVGVTSTNEIFVLADVDVIGRSLIKLNEDGGHVFTRPMSRGSAIAVDPADNIFVAGDGLTMHDADGTELWTAGFSAGVADIAIAPSGAVAITGSVNEAVDFGTGPIVFAGGRDIHVATFNPPSSGSGGAGGGGAGGSGSGAGGGAAETCVPGSVIACYSGPAGTRGVGLCAAGTQTCRPSGFGYGPCTGEVTPTEEICDTPEDESCDGEPSCPLLPPWARGYGSTGADEGLAIASDGAGNTYVAGTFEGTVDFGAGPLTSTPPVADAFLLKLDPSGALLWSKRFENRPFTIAVDGDGNVWLAGAYGSGPFPKVFDQCLPAFGYHTFQRAVFVVKLDRDGNPLWGQGPIVAPDPNFDYFYSMIPEQIAVDALGNAYLAYVNSPGLPHAFLAKLSTTGDVLWNRQLAGPASSVYQVDLAIDGAGHVLSVTAPQSEGAPLTVAKLDPAGAVLWTQQFTPDPSIPPGGTVGDAGWSVAVNAADEVLVAGTTDGTVDFGGGVLPAGPVLLKLDAAGAYVFSDSVAFGDSIAVDGAGNIIVAGSGLAALDASGAELWALSFAADTKDMTITPNGTIALTGAASSAVDFGTGPIPYAAGSDVFVATFTP